MAIKLEHMKRLINIFIGFATILGLTVSCENPDMEMTGNETETVTIDQSLTGEWELQEILAEGTLVSEGLKCYLLINADGTFELYQQSGTQSLRFDRFTGTCTYEDNLLSGVYSNGMPWGAKYTVSIDADILVLKSYNLLEVQKYKKAAIPEDVKENCNTDTRAEACPCNPIL